MEEVTLDYHFNSEIRRLYHVQRIDDTLALRCGNTVYFLKLGTSWDKMINERIQDKSFVNHVIMDFYPASQKPCHLGFICLEEGSEEFIVKTIMLPPHDED